MPSGSSSTENIKVYNLERSDSLLLAVMVWKNGHWYVECRKVKNQIIKDENCPNCLHYKGTNEKGFMPTVLCMYRE